MNTSLASASYSLQIEIAATVGRVWHALAQEAEAWWPFDFHTSERTKRFVIEAQVGGRCFEDFGDGEGLLWFSVVAMEKESTLLLAGHLLPPFGGPAITSLRLTLAETGEATLLEIRDDRFGVLGGDSPVEGWRFVFENGLKRFVESHP